MSINFQMQLQLFFAEFGPEDVLYFLSATNELCPMPDSPATLAIKRSCIVTVL